MKILVTGGSGFLGKHLCRELQSSGHSVRVLDLKKNDEFETIVGDIRSSNVVAEALSGTQEVFHLAGLIEAGESVKNPRDFADVNIFGTITLLEEMKKQNIRKFIFSSSAAVYGEPLRVPILEDDRTMPINPYGMTKLALEALASSYAYSFGFTSVALRYFNLYGPGENHDPETHAIPRFIQQISTGEAVTLWGSGEHQRDFVYISDIVDAHIRSLQLPEGKFHYINLSGKNATKISDLIGLIETILEKKANIVRHEARAGDPLLLFADGTKAKQLLGWESTTPLLDGLRKTVDWFISK